MGSRSALMTKAHGRTRFTAAWMLSIMAGVVVFGAIGSPHADENATNRKRALLKGVKSFDVVVEGLGSDVEPILSQTDMQTTVELRLRQFGLPLSEEGDGYLYVNLNAIPTEEDKSRWAYSLTVEFNQCDAIRARDRLPLGCVGVWNTGHIVVVGSRKFREGALESVRELTDRFINDYLAANPRAVPAPVAPGH